MSDVSPLPSPRFDSLEQEAYLNLWRTYDRLRALEEELFGRYKLTAQQYNSLRLLRGVHPAGLPTLTLGKKLISRSPDITRLLNKLVERGLIERERKDSNRRVVEVRILPAGLDLLREIDPLVRETNQRQLGHLSPADLRELIAALSRARQPHEDPDGLWLFAERTWVEPIQE